MQALKVNRAAVDDEPHCLARIKAAQKGISMSSMLREHLMRIFLEDGNRVPEETGPQRQAGKLDKVMPRLEAKVVGLDANERLNREESYDRPESR